ncbi:proline dehydrogenase [Ceratobasidium sp. AG-Ba]|nr:proline dehydrogenase [Ceratobasidium sp. AG-Ba]
MLRLSAQRAPRPFVRLLHTSHRPPQKSNRLVKLGLGTCALSIAGLTGAVVYADASDTPEIRTPLSTLLRSYIVYSFCSVPALEVSEAVVRRTFFAQFVGGDTCEDTLPLITSLRKQNKGTLLAYSVEVDEKDDGSGKAQWKKNVAEMRSSVDFAADFEDTYGQKGPRKTWVAIKLSALVSSADSLKRMSAFLLRERPRDDVPYPGTPVSFDMIVFNGPKERLLRGGLTEEDIDALRTLYDDLRRVCLRARDRGVRLIFDAEHTWYQPGIDAFVMALSREFNRSPSSLRTNSTHHEQPLVYGTYQAYLKRTPTHLAKSIQDAHKHNYSLGVKLVRGAYLDKELTHHARRPLGFDCPVWPEKAATDACYNSCATTLVGELATSYKFSGAGWTTRLTDKAHLETNIGLLFGTHNNLSCAHIMECLVDSGLAYRSSEGKVIIKEGIEERVCFGQLFGMRDDLTNWVVDTIRANSPMVLKYVPYGALTDVMPYLARRAIENQSILGGEGGATIERRMVGREIKKLLFG